MYSKKIQSAQSARSARSAVCMVCVLYWPSHTCLVLITQPIRRQDAVLKWDPCVVVFSSCARVANQTLYNHTDWFIVCSDIVCFQIHGCRQQKERKNPIIFTRAVSFNSKSTNTLQIIRIFLFCRVFVVQSEQNEVNCCEVHWEQSPWCSYNTVQTKHQCFSVINGNNGMLVPVRTSF